MVQILSTKRWVRDHRNPLHGSVGIFQILSTKELGARDHRNPLHGSVGIFQILSTKELGARDHRNPLHGSVGIFQILSTKAALAMRQIGRSFRKDERSRFFVERI